MVPIKFELHDAYPGEDDGGLVGLAVPQLEVQLTDRVQQEGRRPFARALAAAGVALAADQPDAHKPFGKAALAVIKVERGLRAGDGSKRREEAALESQRTVLGAWRRRSSGALRTRFMPSMTAFRMDEAAAFAAVDLLPGNLAAEAPPPSARLSRLRPPSDARSSIERPADREPQR